MQKYLLAFIAYFAIANTAFAANYYVSPAGSDLNPGSFAKPWKTIAFALCGGGYGCSCSVKILHKVGSGDTLSIRRGTYEERRHWRFQYRHDRKAHRYQILSRREGLSVPCVTNRTGFDIGMYNSW